MIEAQEQTINDMSDRFIGENHGASDVMFRLWRMRLTEAMLPFYADLARKKTKQ